MCYGSYVCILPNKGVGIEPISSYRLSESSVVVNYAGAKICGCLMRIHYSTAVHSLSALSTPRSDGFAHRRVLSRQHCIASGHVEGKHARPMTEIQTRLAESFRGAPLVRLHAEDFFLATQDGRCVPQSFLGKDLLPGHFAFQSASVGSGPLSIKLYLVSIRGPVVAGRFLVAPFKLHDSFAMETIEATAFQGGLYSEIHLISCREI